MNAETNAGSRVAVWRLIDEVLTGRRAEWRAGRLKPWRLRGGTEIAPPLHYNITSQRTSLSRLHHATAEMSWDENNPRHGCESHNRAVDKGKHSEMVQ